MVHTGAVHDVANGLRQINEAHPVLKRFQNSWGTRTVVQDKFNNRKAQKTRVARKRGLAPPPKPCESDKVSSTALTYSLRQKETMFKRADRIALGLAAG